MAMQPSTVASTTFKVVRKGYDPDEVRAYLKQVATALQSAQEHASTVEAKARQAVARAQEAAQQSQRRDPTPPLGERSERDKLDDTATISRTLLLAQRTADETVAAAEQQAATIRAEAEAEAERVRVAARQASEQAAETARSEARKAGEAERLKVESELQQLLARLEFLRDDVAQMEAHAEHHRERLTQVAEELHTIAGRHTAGLAELRRPVLSAAADLSPAEVVIADTGAATLPGIEPHAGTLAAPSSAAADPPGDHLNGTGPDDPPADHTSDGDDLDITAEVPVIE